MEAFTLHSEPDALYGAVYLGLIGRTDDVGLAFVERHFHALHAFHFGNRPPDALGTMTAVHALDGNRDFRPSPNLSLYGEAFLA